MSNWLFRHYRPWTTSLQWKTTPTSWCNNNHIQCGNNVMWRLFTILSTSWGTRCLQEAIKSFIYPKGTTKSNTYWLEQSQSICKVLIRLTCHSSLSSSFILTQTWYLGPLHVCDEKSILTRHVTMQCVFVVILTNYMANLEKIAYSRSFPPHSSLMFGYARF